MEERGLPCTVETVRQALHMLDCDPACVQRYGEGCSGRLTFVCELATGWVFKTRQACEDGLFHFIIVGRDGTVQHNLDEPLAILDNIKRVGVSH